MARVIDLYPGDLVTNGDRSAVYIARAEHPLHFGFSLVIWRLDGGDVSFDALVPHQDVGQIVPSTRAERLERFSAALTGPVTA